MVFGRSIAVTYVPRVSQCAEMHRIAAGFGSRPASCFHDLLNGLSSIAFIGLPCPTKRTGILADAGRLSLILRNPLREIMVNAPMELPMNFLRSISQDKHRVGGMRSGLYQQLQYFRLQCLAMVVGVPLMEFFSVSPGQFRIFFDPFD